MQVTKFDIIHNIQYTDCKGNVRLAKEEKVNTLLELMESDPEMKKRFDELMMNKTAK